MNAMQRSRQDLADRILAFMTAPPRRERIFRRYELERLGSSADVDAALQFLAATHRVGSPARDIWFPLEPFTDELGQLRYAAPALLPDMGRALLAREGVPTRADQVARNHPSPDSWAIPTFMHIGVERPVPLRLEWDQGLTLTEYQGEYLLPASDEPYTPVDIPDPDALRRCAARKQTRPERVEKDIWVNRALQILGRIPMPSVPGQLYFWGGTCLTKGWQLTPRFSEDIDLRFQPPRGRPADVVAARKPVHDWLRAWVQQELAPCLPDAALEEPASSFAPGRFVQRVLIAYRSHFVPEPQTLKLEIGFSPFRVPGYMRRVRAWPHMLPGPGPQALTQLPCVPEWATMTGKLHALAHVDVTQSDMPIMRHVADLGIWIQSAKPHLNSPALLAYMAQQGLEEGTVPQMLDGLLPALAALESHPRGLRLYRDYVVNYYPGSMTQLAPDFRGVIADIRALWDAVGCSDFDDPRYAVAAPDEPWQESASRPNKLAAVDRDTLPPPIRYY